MRSPGIDYDLRERREDRAERHGRTMNQARELWQQAAQTASCCAACFRQLSAAASVTIEVRNFGSCHRPHWLSVPVCLLCTLDSLVLVHPPGGVSRYFAPTRRRTHCANCERPIRTHAYSRGARTCCADCQRALRYRRNDRPPRYARNQDRFD